MAAFELADRVALITGGARGLGAAIAAKLASCGATVMLGDLLVDEAEKIAEAINASGGKAGALKLDVTDETSWDVAISETVETFGGLDILVNNAGVEVTALLTEFDRDEVAEMLDINIMGPLLGMKHGFRAMRPGGPSGRGGSIVNVSSVASRLAVPSVSGYSATKSAVDRMTRVGAMEAGKLGYGIRVNCIYPGLVMTKMGVKLADDLAAIGLFPDSASAQDSFVEQTPLGRLGTAEEMGDAVCFLCSDSARFITGVGIAVDGGMSM